MLRPLIISLRLDEKTFAWAEALRRAHFPPERNVLSAHVTLFHAIPGEEEEGVRRTMAEACATTEPLALSFPGVRFLGRGVALSIESAGLLRVRAALAQRWQHLLTRQDGQRFQPHLTIQNKVEPPVARALFEELGAGWPPRNGRGEGLFLWRYLGGPWELVEAFDFTPSPPP